MKKSIRLAAVVLSTIVAINSVSVPVAFASDARAFVVVEENYDPFADDEVKKVEVDKSQLTFTQRLELKRQEEAKKAVKITIDNVLPGHIYIFPRKLCLM